MIGIKNEAINCPLIFFILYSIRKTTPIATVATKVITQDKEKNNEFDNKNNENTQ
jgi:hypothetical protein